MKKIIFSIYFILNLTIIQTIEAREINVFHIGYSADALLYLQWHRPAPAPARVGFSLTQSYPFKNNTYHFKYKFPGERKYPEDVPNNFGWEARSAPENLDYYIIGLSSEICEHKNIEGLKNKVRWAVSELKGKGDHSKILITQYPTNFAPSRPDINGKITVDPSCDFFNPNNNFKTRAYEYNAWIRRFNVFGGKVRNIDPWRNFSVRNELDQTDVHAGKTYNLQIHPDTKALETAVDNFFNSLHNFR
ncbi:MAG: hypothetical protein V3U87_04985 [Methylococcaceae bacterium]